MTLRLTWTNSSTDLDLYLTVPACNNNPFFDTTPACAYLGISDAGQGTTETITRTVSNGETFKAWVDNFTDAPQSYTLQLTVD